MNADPETALTLASSPEVAQSLAEQDVSEATREALLSACAAETRRIYAMHVRAFGAWIEEDVLLATPIDVANYMAGPGAERSHSWRLQAAAAITGTFEEAGLAPPATHAGVRRTLKGLRRQNPGAPRQSAPLTEAVIAAIEAPATKPRIGHGSNLECEAQTISCGQLDIAFIRVTREALLRRRGCPYAPMDAVSHIRHAILWALRAPDIPAHTGCWSRGYVCRAQRTLGSAHSLAESGARLVELQQARS